MLSDTNDLGLQGKLSESHNVLLLLLLFPSTPVREGERIADWRGVVHHAERIGHGSRI